MGADKTRILLVEEEPFCIWLVQTTLEARGYELFATSDADGVVGLIMTWDPDLVILGCRPPDLDGFELCHEIREFSPVPIIMLSRLVDDTALVQGLNSGADDFVTKPFSAGELLARTQALLRRVEFSRQGDPWNPIRTEALTSDHAA
jgi:DNA-binding response OmpR family regulator